MALWETSNTLIRIHAVEVSNCNLTLDGADKYWPDRRYPVHQSERPHMYLWKFHFYTPTKEKESTTLDEKVGSQPKTSPMGSETKVDII
jgi:hypothetical protein